MAHEPDTSTSASQASPSQDDQLLLTACGLDIDYANTVSQTLMLPFFTVDLDFDLSYPSLRTSMEQDAGRDADTPAAAGDSAMLNPIAYPAPHEHARSSPGTSLEASLSPTAYQDYGARQTSVHSDPIEDTFAPCGVFRPHVGSDARHAAAVRRRSTERRAPAYACAHCDRTYTRKANLDDHVQRHENRLLYTCSGSGPGNACTSRFNTLHDLRSHRKLVHRDP
ncbi:hypothetical protein EV715DRAFT_296510 [Schizophyllum commune]